MSKLIADVFDAVLIDNTSGDTIGTTTLQTGNIESTVEENEVRGGKGNPLIAILRSSRDVNITLEDVCFRYEWLAKQLGQNIVTGAGIGYAMPKWYEVVDEYDDLIITLDEEPLVEDSGLVIRDEDGNIIDSDDYTVSGAVVEFTSGVEEGDRVEVVTYRYATDAGTETVEINSTTFPGSATLILETLEIEDEVPLAKIQYQFTNTMLGSNFTVNTTSAREASVKEIPARALKERYSDRIGRVLRIPIISE